MRFQSTRAAQHEVEFSAALRAGIAPDGGLYVPTAWPTGDRAALAAASARGLAPLAAAVLAPFLKEDRLEAQLPAIAATACNFPAPLVWLDPQERLGVLELFHGPTAAFKDFGARFLAAACARLPTLPGRPLHILVATSGDTGGAVAAAFHRQPGVEVAVLYPQGLVSPTQEQQLTCWGENVRSLAVRGRFDDCQRLVKEAFADPALRARFELSSANSINVARLLPQMVYYWASSLEVFARHGEPASFVIPSGNLGNATACLWARRLGAPIDQIVLAHNANRTVPDYLEQGVLTPRASLATMSSAMDVGQPSNLERLTALYPQLPALRAAVSAVSIDDAATAARIRADHRRYGRIWCPHTAVAAEAYERLPERVRAGRRWVLVATAHPAKFRELIEPLVGAPLPLPPSLASLFERPAHASVIDPTPAALRAAL